MGIAHIIKNDRSAGLEGFRAVPGLTVEGRLIDTADLIGQRCPVAEQRCAPVRPETMNRSGTIFLFGIILTLPISPA